MNYRQIKERMYREAILAIQCAHLAKEAGQENYFDWITDLDDGTIMENIPEGTTAQAWFDQQYPIIESLAGLVVSDQEKS